MKKNGMIRLDNSAIGVRMKMGCEASVYLTLTDTHRQCSLLQGLCGNYNNDYKDDFQALSGKVMKDSDSFANSYLIKTTKAVCKPTFGIPDFCNGTQMKMAAAQKCSYLQSNVFKKCQQLIDTERWVKLCQNEICSAQTSQQEKQMCKVFESYSEDCREEGVVIQWRRKDVCPKTCPAGFIYTECTTACEPTCSRLYSFVPDECYKSCSPGCQCKPGTIRDGDKCVLPKDCSCVYKDKRMPAGSTVQMDCNKCVCKLGRWECTEQRCPSKCTVSDRALYKTFDGTEFRIEPAACKYTLIEPQPNIVDERTRLKIEAVYESCGGTMVADKNCLKGFTIQSAKMSVEISDVTAVVNSDVVKSFPFIDADIYIKQVSSEFFFIHMKYLDILYKPKSQISITVDPVFASKNFEKAQTLCNIIKDTKVFGQCYEVVNYQPYFDRCLHETCLKSASGPNTPFCNILSEYAKKCADNGKFIKWYESQELSNLCPFQCDVGKSEVYSVCHSLKSSHCSDFTTIKGKCQEECIPGCGCPKNMHYDSTGNCVPLADCSCYDKKQPSKTFKSGQMLRKACSKCTCSNAEWDCEKKSCDEIICPKYQIYITKTAICQKTCANFDQMMKCEEKDKVIDECGCPEGKVMSHNGRCVEKDECPCRYDNKWYKPGHKIKIGCKELICRKNVWVTVSKSDCAATCWAAGDPHYQTLDGKSYTFMGNCMYVLSRSLDKTFSIITKNVKCGLSSVTCTKAIEVAIKKQKIFMTRGVGLKVNENLINQTFAKFQDIIISRSGFFYHIFTNIGLVIQWDGATRVYVHVSPVWMGKVEGLCGNYDGNAENDFRGPDNAVRNLASDFGHSWRLQDCMAVPQTKPSDEKIFCNSPERKMWAQSACNPIRRGPLFERCRQATGDKYKTYYDDCVQDACGCDTGGDCECLCAAISNFADMCSRHNIYIKWRSQELCPIQCEENFRYSTCGSPCPQTCRNIGDEPEPYCKTTKCIEGCFCAPGFIRDGKKCVPAIECPCYMNGLRYSPGTKLNMNCKECVCSVGKFQCTKIKDCPKKCQPGEFRCAMGECIANKYKCDKTIDCRDGSDELNCNYTCKPGEFECGDGNCIPLSKKCNGLPDCVLGSDETNCNVTCHNTQFTCKNKKCIPKSFKCDGHVDCGIDDNSDETSCPTERCNAREFTCSMSGNCIPITKKCDGHDDCGDASDEIGCTCTCKDQFTCGSCDCIPKEKQCDGKIDCSDGSDEKCACSVDEFTCNNKQCIDSKLKCNDKKDCTDGSDELYCKISTLPPLSFENFEDEVTGHQSKDESVHSFTTTATTLVTTTSPATTIPSVPTTTGPESTTETRTPSPKTTIPSTTGAPCDAITLDYNSAEVLITTSSSITPPRDVLKGSYKNWVAKSEPNSWLEISFQTKYDVTVLGIGFVLDNALSFQLDYVKENDIVVDTKVKKGIQGQENILFSTPDGTKVRTLKLKISPIPQRNLIVDNLFLKICNMPFDLIQSTTTIPMTTSSCTIFGKMLCRDSVTCATICDGQVECSDGSDEKGCKTTVPTTAPTTDVVAVACSIALLCGIQISQKHFWNSFLQCQFTLLLMTGLTFLATCYNRRHLVIFDTSSLPQLLKISLFVRHKFRTTSLSTRDKVRFKATLDLPLSALDRTGIGDCTNFFTLR
ncbi:SCO-spondin-like [Octopus bimaculoides]|nr:SCO-spondin-like [Octopus bimaculoides]